MNDKPPSARFVVRIGARAGTFMVYDRNMRGPAKIGGQPQVGLAKEQAERIRDSLETYFASKSGTKDA